MVRKVFYSAAFISLSAATAHAATYTPHVLPTSPGSYAYTDSFGNSSIPGLQGGYAIVAGESHAVRWDTTTASFVDLNSAVNEDSLLNSISSTNQVGTANIDSVERASVWTGAAFSEMQLPDTSFSSSAATSTTGSIIVGFGEIGGNDNALLWTASGPSYIATDLHPSDPTYTGSFARSTDGVTITGAVTVGGPQLGATWQVSAPATSFTLLGGTWDSSIGWSVSGDQIVGQGTAGGLSHAILWTNNGSTVTDLQTSDPAIASSFAYSTNGINQVGSITLDDVDSTLVPYLWSGTAASGVPLLLPTGFTMGEAESIDSAGNIVGYGIDAGGHMEALLWTASATPEPTTLLLLTPLALGMLSRKRRCC